jgi:CBS domain-containing protein
MPVSPDPPHPLAALATELARHPPFAQMTQAHCRQLLASAELVRFAPDEVVLAPASGPVTRLYVVQSGQVQGEQRLEAPEPLALEPGEMFPVSALLGARPVTATYRARGDTTCLQVPGAVVHDLIAASPPFADFVNRRILQLLELSQRALHTGIASRVLAEQSMQAPLADFARRAPLTVPPATPLGDTLRQMQERRVGSVIVTGGDGQALGILTRHDLLDRVALPGRALDTPIAELMSWPVHTLSTAHRANDAALLMSREGIRHVAITERGRVVGIVTERDLFALQRMSIKEVGSALREAGDVAALRASAADIRRLALQLVAQGVQARQVTELISQLNDRLTARLVELLAAQQGLDLRRACWLAFGSEGREEQTLATDQDNGLVFVSDSPATERPRWLALGQAVNEALDACGYPLCRGGVMAGLPACCLSTDEWRERFAHWIAHGAPQDLLDASIYFDLRPIAGERALAAPLRQVIDKQAAATPRFLKQMAQNALQHRAPLNWHGGIAGDSIDLKLQGTAIFVEAARLLALATGVGETGTRRRLEAAAAPLGVPATEAAAWVAGFEFLQLLRLGVQTGTAGGEAANRCEIAALNAIDRRVLRETLRVARGLQQRIELDYLR